MSLLDDVSIVVTPNGYKAGELYAVVPVPTYGADVVEDGDFPLPNVNWSASGGAEITINGARINNTVTGVNAYIKQVLSGIVNGRQFILTYDVITTNGTTLALEQDNAVQLNTSTTGTNRKLYFTWDRYNNDVIIKRLTTGTDVTIDNVILQELTSADMDVTRATAATRVDENGLVNYAEIIGGEEVTDGSFPTPNTAWDVFNGATVSGGKANIVGDGSVFGYISQSSVFTNGKTYKVTLDAVITSGGGLSVKYSTAYGDNIGFITTTGSYTFYYTATSDYNLVIGRTQSGVAYDSSVTNVSVKEVTRDNVPRIDYTGGGCPHILAEPMRTNLIPYSEDLTEWNKGSSTIDSNDIVSPDGTQNADTITVPDSNEFIYESITTTESTEYVFSFYVKRGTIAESALKLAVYDDTANSFIVVDVSYSASDSEWTRVTQSFTTPVGCILIRAYAFRNSSSTLGTFSIWGGQVEAGSYATSYIPNFGTVAGVTRNQDIFTRDGIGSLINSTEGCVFGEGNFAESNSSIYNYFVSLSDGTPNNRLEIRQSASNLQFLWRVATYQSEISTSSLDVSSNFKFALNYSASNIKFYVNGDLIGTINTPTLWSANTLNRLAFDNGAGGDRLSGKVKQLQVYDTALTDEQLLQLTGESGTDFYESYAEMASALTYTIQ